MNIAINAMFASSRAITVEQNQSAEIMWITFSVIAIVALVGCLYYLTQILAVLRQILDHSQRHTTDARRLGR